MLVDFHGADPAIDKVAVKITPIRVLAHSGAAGAEEICRRVKRTRCSIRIVKPFIRSPG